ncbi:hypothetical protein AtubIFM54640_002256 [Aspergillus tubingensis]|nr:hypothetical protein AtubIFM54640_002256 [Aspergillus tubingensis]
MPKAPLLKGLLLPIGEIPLDSIHPDPNISCTKKDLKTITSYNLLPKKEKSMVVPGTPSIYKPPTTPTHIPPDSGKYILDPNSLIFPNCTLEPLLRAITTTTTATGKPKVNLTTTDLITDRRNLRLLLSFVSSSKKPFRIDVEVINTTVLLSLWTSSKTNFVGQFQGYGHSFEKAATWNPRYIRGSIIHNRAVRYTLGGIHILLRVINSGTLVHPNRIIEIKTGPVSKRLDNSKNLEQMWFSHTPILCTGQYQPDGTFLPARAQNMEKEGRLEQWERDNEEKIRRLVRVLEMVFEVVRGVPHRCALVHDGDGVLRVYQVDENAKGGLGRGVPRDLRALWDVDVK